MLVMMLTMCTRDQSQVYQLVQSQYQNLLKVINLEEVRKGIKENNKKSRKDNKKMHHPSKIKEMLVAEENSLLQSERYIFVHKFLSINLDMHSSVKHRGKG
jgi:hypothetical protein